MEKSWDEVCDNAAANLARGYTACDFKIIADDLSNLMTKCDNATTQRYLTETVEKLRRVVSQYPENDYNETYWSDIVDMDPNVFIYDPSIDK